MVRIAPHFADMNEVAASIGDVRRSGFTSRFGVSMAPKIPFQPYKGEFGGRTAKRRGPANGCRREVAFQSRSWGRKITRGIRGAEGPQSRAPPAPGGGVGQTGAGLMAFQTARAGVRSSNPSRRRRGRSSAKRWAGGAVRSPGSRRH